MTGRPPAKLERETDVLLMLERLHQTMTELTAVTRGLIVNKVLTSELVLIPASGAYASDWSVPFASVAVENLGTHPMTVAGSGPQLAAPGPGPGNHQIPGGGSATINLAGRELTIYGTPGDLANLQVFTDPRPPTYTGGIAPGPIGLAVNATGANANATVTATLPAVAGKTTYVTGFEVTGSGATAAFISNAAVTGTIGANLQYTIAVPAGANLAIAPLVINFTQGIPATGPNEAISLVVTAFGAGNTLVTANIHGYYL